MDVRWGVGGVGYPGRKGGVGYPGRQAGRVEGHWVRRLGSTRQKKILIIIIPLDNISSRQISWVRSFIISMLVYVVLEASLKGVCWYMGELGAELAGGV